MSVRIHCCKQALKLAAFCLAIAFPLSAAFSANPPGTTPHFTLSTYTHRTSSRILGPPTTRIPPTNPPQQRFDTSLHYGELRGVDAQLLFDTWEWTANLGAPAALVAGAVLATMIDGREYMSPRKSDPFHLKIIKKECRLLLLSSFGLEIISIFVTTVTGTMLLSHGDAKILSNLDFSSPLGFLMHNFEFEYLTSRIAFLQGLFNWLASVALELLIPRHDESESAHLLNRFTASSLLTIMVAMLSFLNRHLTFYSNYATMLRRYAVVCFKQFIWPLQPLTIVLIPMTIWTMVLGFRAFSTKLSVEDDLPDTKTSDPKSA